MSQRSLTWKETFQISLWLCQFWPPVDVHLAYYGGSYIPALSTSCLCPLLVVLLRLLVRFWSALCICCIFLLYFKLIALTNVSGKCLIFYVWSNGLKWQNPNLQEQHIRFTKCIVFALSAVCSRLHFMLSWVVWEHCLQLWYGVVLTARSCHHLRRNLWAFLILMDWWFW